MLSNTEPSGTTNDVGPAKSLWLMVTSPPSGMMTLLPRTVLLLIRWRSLWVSWPSYVSRPQALRSSLS